MHAANPFATGPVDSSSPVAGAVTAASSLSGGYPKFSEVPPVPTDVRPISAWRQAVIGAWALKVSTEAQAARIPFTLNNSLGWAAAERAKIPADQATPPAADNSAETEAYAAALRARATPPPPPN